MREAEAEVYEANDRQLVGFVTNNGKFHTLDEFEKLKSAISVPSLGTQDLSRLLGPNKTYGGDEISPPYTIKSLQYVLRISTIHSRCCMVKATDSVSHLNVRPAMGVDVPQADQDLVETFIKEGGGEHTLEDLLEIIMFDFESVGFSAIEIGRDYVTGNVRKLFHAPAETIRLTKTGQIKQVTDKGTVFFQQYPEKFTFDPLTGKRIWNFISPITGKPLSRGNPKDSATEILIFKKHHPLSPHYGLPDFVTATPAMLGNMLAREFNLNRFTNWMVPSYAILVTGGLVDPKTRLTIEAYFEEIQGTKRDTLILALPNKDAKIEFKKLEADVEEASFGEYTKDNRNEVLLAHGVHPARIGIIETASLGGGSAVGQLMHYKNAVIDPRQRRLTRFLEHSIFYLGMNVQGMRARFSPVDIADIETQSKVLTNYKDSDIMTVNECRAVLNLAPMEEVQPNPAPPPVEEKMLIVDDTKAFRKQTSLEMDRRILTFSYNSIWDTVDSEEPNVEKEKKKLKKSLLLLSAGWFEQVLLREADELKADLNTDVDTGLLGEELNRLVEKYFDENWLEDFEIEMNSALEFQGDMRIEKIEKVKQRMASRSFMYAGLLLTAASMVVREGAKNLGRLVQWKTLGKDACPDCQELERNSPWSPNQLPTLPGRGDTKCLGNCRCVLEIAT